MLLLGLTEFVCMIGVPVTLIGFLFQLFRKKANKKQWGIALLAFLFVTMICFIVTPISEEQEIEKPTTNESNTTLQTTTSSAHEEPTEVKEKTDVEKFADKNDISIELAESLENVLVGMELTDKSKVGVFHYDISDVYEWKQIEDWANGQRFSAYMDMEHVWYIYVTGNEVVGVRDGHGNVFYTKE